MSLQMYPEYGKDAALSMCGRVGQRCTAGIMPNYVTKSSYTFSLGFIDTTTGCSYNWGEWRQKVVDRTTFAQIPSGSGRPE